jgi:hypothetical protein
VSELAAAVGLLPSRFSHLFALQTGMVPWHYLCLVRQYRSEQLQAQAIFERLPVGMI